MSRFRIVFESFSKAVAGGVGGLWDKFPPELTRISGLVSLGKSPSPLAKALSFMESNVVKRNVKEREDPGKDVRSTKEAVHPPSVTGKTDDVSAQKEGFGIPYFDEDFYRACNDGGPVNLNKPKQVTSKGRDPPTDVKCKDVLVVENGNADPSLNSQRSTSSSSHGHVEDVRTSRDSKGRVQADPGHVQRGITDRLLLPVTSVQSMVSGWASKLKEHEDPGKDVRSTKEAVHPPAVNGKTDDVSSEKEVFSIPYFDEDFDRTCNDGGPANLNKPKQVTSKGRDSPTDVKSKDALVVENGNADPSLNSQHSTSSSSSSSHGHVKDVRTSHDSKGRVQADPGHLQRGIADRLLLPVTSVQTMVSGWASKLKEQTEERSVREMALQVKKRDEADSDKKSHRLRLQREKVIARVSVDNTTRGLVQILRSVHTPDLKLSHLNDLILHLIQYPHAHTLAVEEMVIPFLLRTRQESNVELAGAAREALALVGYAGPVRGEGVRVLSIDGGGTRGLVALHTLEKLEQLAGRPIHELFDFICGVSTGAILAFMIGIYRIPLQQCHDMYRQLASDIFRQNVILGAVKMGWSHAFYDSQAWERLLRERSGELLMIETACNAACPKVAVVSTVVNRGANPKLFVFRNYNHRPGARPHYAGSCQHKIWQATRASSAAPGFFEECQLGADLHQDGALLANNPCGVAVHECQLLWPGTPLQCVVSLGTGRYESASRPNQTHTSLKAKLNNVITSATDTEEVHTLLDGLLPPDTYFRFNPLTGTDVALDERRVERLEQLRLDTEAYLSRNSNKLSRAAARLTKPRRPLQRLADWLQLKMDAWDKGPRTSNAHVPSKL
uniref:Patatin-like phospholipase domain containing 8 n=1 Tax=Eptatretus burgeri TaxID=7764 RepID=A0A8C4R786_EPTBU